MRILALLPALLGLLAACQPAATPAPAVAGDALAALRAQYGVQPQVFDYNPQRVDVFRLAGGGALAMGSQAFLDLASGTPAPGPLRLEVRELLTKADMVLSGRPLATPDGLPLESGGQYLVQATTAEQRPLRLSPRVKLGLAEVQPPQLTSPYGLTLFVPLYPADPYSAWQPAADTASSVKPSVPLTSADPVYLRCLIAKGLYDGAGGWLAFAKPIYSAAPPATVRVRLDQPAEANKAAVYLVLRDYNAVAQLVPLGQGEFALPNVPGQLAATVFALYTAGGKLYQGQQALVTQPGSSPLAIVLAEHSLAEVAAAARQLP